MEFLPLENLVFQLNLGTEMFIVCTEKGSYYLIICVTIRCLNQLKNKIFNRLQLPLVATFHSRPTPSNILDQLAAELLVLCAGAFCFSGHTICFTEQWLKSNM